jgi:hypothetical protein
VDGVGAKIEEALDSISFDDLLQQHARHKELAVKPKKKATIAVKGGC